MTLNKDTFQVSEFNELSRQDLYQILQLRNAVFVLEQACPYLDVDGLDQSTWHIYQKIDRVVAYARINPPDKDQPHCRIGRVVVDQSHRQQQLGRQLMLAAMAFCQEQFPTHAIKISAQSYLHRFYQDLGFVATGEYYLEDDIPHQAMLYRPT